MPRDPAARRRSNDVEPAPAGAGVSAPRRGGAILLVRTIHGAITAFFLSCLGLLYYAAITGEHEFAGWMAAALLAGEGVVVGLNGGDCPLGRVHHRLGDDRAFFELLMPKAMAKRAVPFFAAVAIAGMALLLV